MNIIEALEWMGERTPEVLDKEFKAMGIRNDIVCPADVRGQQVFAIVGFLGLTFRGRTCPVAQFLARQGYSVGVGSYEVSYLDSTSAAFTLPLPESVREFVRMADTEYHEMLAEG